MVMKIDEILFSETDDACAICGLRGPDILTIHHIDEDRSNNDYDNQIVLCHNCHQRYNQDKGLTRTQIEDRKRHLILKTITQYGLNALKIASRNNFGIIAMPFLLYHLVDMGYMTKEEVLIKYEQGDAEARFAITEEGRKLLKNWFA